MHRFSGIEAVIFDIGDTLLDFQRPESRREFRAGIREAHAYLTGEGLDPPPLDAYRHRLERRFIFAYLWCFLRRAELDPMVQLRATHASLGLALDDARLVELSNRFYAPTMAIAHAAPGCADAIRELQRRGYRLALISNTIAPPTGLDAHLAAEGLLELFPIRIYSCMVGVPKPHPRIFHAALERLALPAGRTMYVGDKPRIDVAGARRVGMATALRTRNGRPVPPGPAPDVRVKEIHDLLEHLPPRGA